MIERMSYENVAVRLLCADTHPDHDTICTFRRRNAELLHRAFAQVLELAARCGVLKVGGVTVAIDGTKILANASKHSAVSYERAGQQMQELDLEITQLLAKAEEVDSKPLEDGLTIPEEVTRRHERKAKLAAARAEMEARAHVRAQAERVEYEAKVAAREAARAAGKKPRGEEPKPPSGQPSAKDQVNFTDPESRIMPGGGAFVQAFNAQAGVEIGSRLIVTQRVTNAPNDKRELVANMAVMEPAVGSVKTVLVHNGFYSEEAVRAVEENEQGESTGIRVLAALKRDRHGRRVADLEKKRIRSNRTRRHLLKITWPIEWPPRTDASSINSVNKPSSRCSGLSKRPWDSGASPCVAKSKSPSNGPSCVLLTICADSTASELRWGLVERHSWQHKASP